MFKYKKDKKKFIDYFYYVICYVKVFIIKISLML